MLKASDFVALPNRETSTPLPESAPRSTLPMIGLLDRILDHTTMYRLVLLYLAALLGTAFIFGFFGLVPHEPATIAFSTLLILVSSWAANAAFAAAFRLP